MPSRFRTRRIRPTRSPVSSTARWRRRPSPRPPKRGPTPPRRRDLPRSPRTSPCPFPISPVCSPRSRRTPTTNPARASKPRSCRDPKPGIRPTPLKPAPGMRRPKTKRMGRTSGDPPRLQNTLPGMPRPRRRPTRPPCKLSPAPLPLSSRRPRTPFLTKPRLAIDRTRRRPLPPRIPPARSAWPPPVCPIPEPKARAPARFPERGKEPSPRFSPRFPKGQAGRKPPRFQSGPGAPLRAPPIM